MVDTETKGFRFLFRRLPEPVSRLDVSMRKGRRDVERFAYLPTLYSRVDHRAEGRNCTALVSRFATELRGKIYSIFLGFY